MYHQIFPTCWNFVISCIDSSNFKMNVKFLDRFRCKKKLKLFLCQGFTFTFECYFANNLSNATHYVRATMIVVVGTLILLSLSSVWLCKKKTTKYIKQIYIRKCKISQLRNYLINKRVWIYKCNTFDEWHESSRDVLYGNTKQELLYCWTFIFFLL